MDKKRFGRSSWLRWMALLTTGMAYQTTGCQVTDANSLIAGWLSSIAGSLITDYVNDAFNTSGGF